MVFSSLPAYLDPANWQQQQNHPTGTSSAASSHLLPPPPPPPPPPQPHMGGGGAGSIRPGSMADRARMANIPMPETALKCPRCDSSNTKFCYFNNYSLTQPRHFCKTCRRYWTRGGALRNVPVGGDCRRNKRSKGSSSSKSPASSADRQSASAGSASSIPSHSGAGDMIGERMAIRVTNIANIVLFALKVSASIESKSLSIIAAILDPFFDLLWGFILWLTSHAMQNPNPHKYPIGKERMQPVGMIVFGSFGLQLLFLAAKQFITKSKPTKDPQKQKWMIGVMTFVTMVDFMLAFYCRRFENKIVRAYAEHHSSNVKTNLISLAAAVLAIRYYWWIDPTGAIIILLYTMHSWKKTFFENLFALIGRTAPPEILDRLTSLVLEHHEDIKQIGRLTAYTSGPDQYFVEVDIVLPQDMVQSKTRDIVGTLQVKLSQLPEVARAFVREYDSRAEHRIMVDDKDDDEDCKN